MPPFNLCVKTNGRASEGVSRKRDITQSLADRSCGLRASPTPTSRLLWLLVRGSKPFVLLCLIQQPGFYPSTTRILCQRSQMGGLPGMVIGYIVRQSTQFFITHRISLPYPRQREDRRVDPLTIQVGQRSISEQKENRRTIKMLYKARASDLGPRDFVKVECIACGHVDLLPSDKLRIKGLPLPAYTPVPDLERRLRCRECDTRGKAVVSIRWAQG